MQNTSSPRTFSWISTKISCVDEELLENPALESGKDENDEDFDSGFDEADDLDYGSKEEEFDISDYLTADGATATHSLLVEIANEMNGTTPWELRAKLMFSVVPQERCRIVYGTLLQYTELQSIH